jgi:hypothetical protein
MRSNNTKPKKPYVLRKPDGSIAAGTLTYSFKKPKPGDWIEVINENTEYRNPTSYTNTVRVTYPNAVSAQAFGEYTKKFLKNLGYPANDTLMSLSVCSDDINAANFVDNDNLGQHPLSLNDFLGPFMSGGLAGYPHTGITGLGAYASHVTNTGNLFVMNMPHIGISSNGTVGSIIRRGQTGQNTSCGAVQAAINWAINNAGLPVQANFADDYQQFFITNILASVTNRGLLAPLTGSATSAQMVIATEILRDAGQTFLVGTTGIKSIGGANLINGSTRDIFFMSGTFINVDDGYEAYIDVVSFQKLAKGASTFTDLTTTFKAGLPK